MDSEDSRDGGGDAQSSSSSSSSSSRSRSRRSSSSDHSNASKKSSKSQGKSSKPHRSPKSPRSPQSPRSQSPKSPTSDSQSGSPMASPRKLNRPPSPENLNEVHSDINSPENSMPASPLGPKSPEPPKSPSDNGSNPVSPESRDKYSSIQTEGPRTPRSPGSASSVRSAPASPDNNSRPTSPNFRPASPNSTPASPNSRPASPNSRPASPNSRPASPNSQPASPDKFRPTSLDSTKLPRSPEKQYRSSSSPSPDRAFTRSSPPKSPKNTWNTQETWRRHTKAEQKMVSAPRSRSRSASSSSSRSSSYNKRAGAKDTEEISEGEMESDQEDRKSRSKSNASEKREHKDLNMSHEDLSDVSDLDSVGADDIEKQSEPKFTPASPDSNKVEVNGNNAISSHSSPKQDFKDKIDKEVPKLEKTPQEKTSNTEDGEEQLDFEAEEGECVEPKTKEPTNGDIESQSEKEEGKPGRRSRGSSLEEGEVSDEGERRPEESEPRPVCRFFSRGVCTWGVSCRFLHPGVTDKGNYNMFDVVRGVPPTGPFTAPSRDVAPPESAWERGLRTAKEMLRVANKRKEQDMDFEEKKLHLSVGGAVHDPDAELAYAAAAVGASPPRVHEPRDSEHYSRPPYGPMYRGRFVRPPPVDERERYYEYERGYERGERPYERAPHYDERPVPPDDASYKRRIRSSREVIVQRAEVERRDGRGIERDREPRRERERERGGDEWADPWMRAEPAARKRRPPSSDESYSSSSSRSSRSPGAKQKQRASSSSRHRLSPSVIVRERRLATARATAMNPPAPRRRAPSPTAARQLSANPPAPAPIRHKEELDPYGRSKASSRGRDRKKYSRSSSSGSDSSSSSSESESDSRSSSTSGSSGAKRARHARLLNAAARPRANVKSNSGLAAAVSSITSKKESTSDKEMGKKRPADSPPNSGPAKKSVSRREELLKQLKAVEDAIARKRSKI